MKEAKNHAHKVALNAQHGHNTVHYNVLHSVAECRIVLQSVALCCRVSHCVAECRIVLQRLQYVTVCCSVLQCLAVSYSVLQCAHEQGLKA